MRRGSGKTYKVFVRNWWRYAADGDRDGTLGGRLRLPTDRAVVPDPTARRTTIATRCTEEEARSLAQEYNRTHEPGPLSRKAEYTEE